MPPVQRTATLVPDALAIIQRNHAGLRRRSGAYDSHVWKGGLNVASVDLIAMLVSDAGLSNLEPQWWNASPSGCFLIGLQPRGGWQIMQRAVQWGNDRWAHSFGVDCSKNVMYSYFACSIRNRLEVWDSDRFDSPTQVSVAAKPHVPPRWLSDILFDRKKMPEPREWRALRIDGDRTFSMDRPSKLTDGSRGGQAFMCEILKPPDGKTYNIADQARMQLLSVMLVAIALIKQKHLERWECVLTEEFQLNDQLGVIFRRLLRFLMVANVFVVGFIISAFYALWVHNIFGNAAPYLIQLCSIASWAFGAIGLLMLGGNPRVRIKRDKETPTWVEERFDALPLDGAEEGKCRQAELKFGYLQGTTFTPVQGSCRVPLDIVKLICQWDLILTRSCAWYGGMIWCAAYLGVSIVLQIAGAKVATVPAEVMAVVILILTSVVRGTGVSGSEERMIPSWKVKPDTAYGATLLGKMMSRV
ncbi:hypothetical protein CLAIMM_04256 [Cladophialophora immunda]|nr:hypothetical protein CLAIMM_04256 [Cladophialophora immunda]